MVAIILLWAIEMFSIEQDITYAPDAITFSLSIRLRHSSPTLPISQAQDHSIYQNNTYGFEINYPAGWTVSEQSPEYATITQIPGGSVYGQIFVAVKGKERDTMFLRFVQEYAAARNWSTESHNITSIGDKIAIEIVNHKNGFDKKEYVPRLFFAELSDDAVLEVGVSYDSSMQTDAEKIFDDSIASIAFLAPAAQ
jgi:hypothetical protein